MHGAYLGPEFDGRAVQRMIRKHGAAAEYFSDFSALCDKTATFIADGKVVGWLQGRMEYGPRALGNRSILADPRNPNMQKRINRDIKFREEFRPFAPSVLYEDAGAWFDLDGESPYMLMVATVKKQHRKPAPSDASSLDLYTRLHHERSVLPAVTHVDYSARIQTVRRETNERFRMLLEAFKRQTGVGVLVNTSFNVRGEPIVCTPEEAYGCFMATGMEYLVIGDYLFAKED